MYIRLGIHLFSSKTLSNMLLLILVALSLLVSNVGIGIVNMQLSLLNAVQNFDKENTYYYMDNTEDFEEVENADGSITIKQHTINKTVESANKEHAFDVGYIYYDSAIAYRKQLSFYSKSIIYIGVDNKTSENLNYGQLAEGEWYTKAKKTDGYLNVVAVKGNYEIGDKFNIHLQNDENGIDIKCIVTGLLEQGANMLYPDTAVVDTEMSLNMFMQEAYTKKNGDPLSYIYFSYEDEAINPYIDNLYQAKKCFLYKNANATQEEVYRAIDELSDTGWTVKMQKMCDNTYSYLYERISYLVPFMFGIFLLTIVCLVCIMTLNATDYMKTYSVYYLCGMNWSDMKKILLSYSLIIMIGSALVSALALVFILIQGGFVGLAVFNIYNIFISLGIIMAIILIMVFIPYFMLLKTSPKDALIKN
ncbi:MAG: hypothetical protein ACI4M3_08340 [Acutalibacteraceae bacterium]